VGTSSAAQKISLLNGTGTGLSMSSIQSSANFKQNNTCGVTLAAGAFCYIKVSFNPTSIGIKQAESPLLILHQAARTSFHFLEPVTDIPLRGRANGPLEDNRSRL